VQPPPLAKGLQALPRIASPDAADKKINAALAGFDHSARQERLGCIRAGQKENGEPGSMDRQIDVTMRGPVYFSILVFDGLDCGGVHPYNEQFPLVFDLRTGEIVHWTDILPKGLVKELPDYEGWGSVPLTSNRLQSLYATGYAAQHKTDTQCPGDEVDELVPENRPAQLMLFPDPGGLGIFPVALSQLEFLCVDTVTLDDAAMKSLGISEANRHAILGQPAKP
jgi:hypothetical protein